MDTGSNKFGRGWNVLCQDDEFVQLLHWPRELTGGVDLISYYNLLPHHEFFCKKSGSVSLLDTHYLYDVVGDTDIRKGEGMQLDQLIQNTFPRDTNSCIQPFNLDVLGEAFHLQESASVDLPPSEKGIPTVAVKPKSEFTAKDKHKKHKGKDREKDKELKKHKHRSKEDKEKKKVKNHQKRKRDGDEDTNGSKKHKKSKDKSSKNEVGLKVSSMRSFE